MYKDIKLNTVLFAISMLTVLMGVIFGLFTFIASAIIATLGFATYKALDEIQKTMQEISDTRGMSEEDKHVYFSKKMDACHS